MNYKITLFIGLLVFSNSAFSQDSVADTLGYIKGDVNFNLLVAADEGRLDDVVHFLKEGAKIDFTVQDSMTALMYAVRNNFIEVVNILIEKGADVNKQNDFGETALIMSALNNNTDIAEIILQNNANIDKANYDGVTPLMQSIANGDYVMTDMLLYYGADYTKRDKTGLDALMLSSFLGYTPIDSLLIELGADVNSSDSSGFTSLHLAVQNGYIDVVSLLIAKGANINQQNNKGYTPLAIAVELNDVEMTKFLIGKGAKVNQGITLSMSPLDIAKSNRNDTIKSVLKENKARSNLLPVFHKYYFGFDFIWNFDDFMTGFNFGMSDKKYNIDLLLDYRFRPFATRVLEQESANTYYQYWERRAVWSTGIDKKIRVATLKNNSVTGLVIGVKESFTFGSYRGTNVKPEVNYITVPRAGLYWNSYGFRTKLMFEYLDLNLYEFQKGWINFSISFLIDRKTNAYLPKSISWY